MFFKENPEKLILVSNFAMMAVSGKAPSWLDLRVTAFLKLKISTLVGK